ncbi:MAG TPA: STAS domain-containing protein [Polyangiaceae bacterium]|jgi:rsbT co-antagonist protein RsbR|nr:STAS domain-containing protein [Polyangiaceae bacterium]
MDKSEESVPAVSSTPSAPAPDDPAALRARIAELERRLAGAEYERDVVRHVVDEAPAFISRLTPDGRVIYLNKALEQMIGKRWAEVEGQNILPMFYPGDLWAPIEEYHRIAKAGGDVRDFEATVETHDGRRRVLTWNSYHRFAPDGSLAEVVSFGVDITERKRDEAERRRLQDEVIAMQAAALAELSTPLIPISASIVVMPLIGAIDAARAERIMHALLTGIGETRAKTAILDITGVAVVDTQVADALLRAARAVRLLGAEVILTGIRPDVAQTLVGLGTNLDGIVTRGTLQSGIAFAMQRG